LLEADQPPDKETIPVLVGLVTEEDNDIRVAALNTLALIGMTTKGECPLVMVEAIFDKDEDVSSLAASLVGCYEKFPSEALPLLFRAMEHEDREVRQQIPSVLAKAARDDKRTVPALKKAIADKDWWVRSSAVGALFAATHDFDLVVPHWLLANENYQELTETLRATLTADQQSAQVDANNEASLAVQKMIYHGKKSPQEMGKCLIGLLSDKSPVIRRAAARTLGALAGYKEKTKAVFRELNAHDAVARLLSDSDPSVKRAAKTALEKLGK
jgi:HEAT repeat protein